jgi:hypothetical protein
MAVLALALDAALVIVTQVGSRARIMAPGAPTP